MDIFHQVLLIFSDGLDGNVAILKQESERLRTSGNTTTNFQFHLNFSCRFMSLFSIFLTLGDGYNR